MDREAIYPSLRQPLMARNVVATSQPLAAQAGLRMLLLGGNAVDAALAAAISLPVVEPTSNGLGSDAFAILWDGKSLHGLNGSGRSPAGWSPERFSHLDEMPSRGWDSVTVPGAVSAWKALSVRFGKLPFESLFKPAIEYAEDGYQVSPIIAASWKRACQVLGSEPGFAEAFLPNGRAPEPGQTVRLPSMAHTLRRIAASGGEDFYRGDLARQIAEFSDRLGGVMTLDDLSSHSVDWCGTISLKWNCYELHEIPPNGQGIAALIALGILDRTEGFSNLSPDSAEGIHLAVEAIKLAFADLHRYVSDIGSMEFPPETLLEGDYLRKRAQEINAGRASAPVFGIPTRTGTVYLTAADEDGMMVSFIQSNYMGFGSGLVVPGTGVSLQNRGCGFQSKPGHPNSVGPWKRPFHTIIPGFVTRDGQPVMSFGVMGGPMQAQGHLQMIVRILLHHQNPQQASDAPRWQVMASGKLAVEETMDPRTIEHLITLGHRVTVEPGFTNQSFGGAQLILRQGEGYIAGSDQRKDGMAVGY